MMVGSKNHGGFLYLLSYYYLYDSIYNVIIIITIIISINVIVIIIVIIIINCYPALPKSGPDNVAQSSSIAES